MKKKSHVDFFSSNLLLVKNQIVFLLVAEVIVERLDSSGWVNKTVCCRCFDEYYANKYFKKLILCFYVCMFLLWIVQETIITITLSTKVFGQFKFRTSVCPKFQQLIIDVMTLMTGNGYKKSASHTRKHF